MKNLVIAGALALALFSAPVAAQECDTLDYVKSLLDGNGMTYTEVPANEVQGFLDGTVKTVLGQVPEGVTRVLVAILGDKMVFGLEIGGCMTPPIPFASTGPSA
jgi:hypothetical protein